MMDEGVQLSLLAGDLYEVWQEIACASEEICRQCLVSVWSRALAGIFVFWASPLWAIEGNTAAGPIGGTDMRSAVLPPPGFYAGGIAVGSTVPDIKDGKGETVPGLDAIHLREKLAAPFFLYVPNASLFGGSIGLLGVFPAGEQCGQLVSFVPSRCSSGFGDPYVEIAWSRAFGQLRPSRYPGALPIMEGLVVSLGAGAVLPIGHYDQRSQAQNGASIGNNTLDVAPTAAVTYTTPPFVFDGTEFSAKFYWNNYWTNPATQYKAGALLDIDFAITEHIGKFQAGLAGFYAFQTADDRQLGAIVPPDGHRLKYMMLGGVLNYDMPEYGAVIRVKALTGVFSRNAVVSKAIVIGFAKKLY